MRAIQFQHVVSQIKCNFLHVKNVAKPMVQPEKKKTMKYGIICAKQADFLQSSGSGR